MTIESEKISELAMIELRIHEMEESRLSSGETTAQELSRVYGILADNLTLPVPGISPGRDGSVKNAAQVGMDIIRATQLYSQLVYDVEIAHPFTVKKHTYVESLDLVSHKSKLQGDEDRKTSQERRTDKLKEKYNEIFGVTRDFLHLIEDADKYRDGLSDTYKDVWEPSELLGRIQSFEETNWGEVVHDLRALALTGCEDIIAELIEANQKR